MKLYKIETSSGYHYVVAGSFAEAIYAWVKDGTNLRQEEDAREIVIVQCRSVVIAAKPATRDGKP